jgi:hypothetical protein
LPLGLVAEVISFIATTSYPKNEFIIAFYPTVSRRQSHEILPRQKAEVAP